MRLACELSCVEQAIHHNPTRSFALGAPLDIAGVTYQFTSRPAPSGSAATKGPGARRSRTPGVTLCMARTIRRGNWFAG
jgi:hypothetical protein